MLKFTPPLLIALSIACGALALTPKSENVGRVVMQTGFEEANGSEIDLNFDRIVAPDRYELTTEIARSGRQSMAILLQPGDRVFGGFRAEAADETPVKPPFNVTYKFSVLFPVTNKFDSKKFCVFAQIHDQKRKTNSEEYTPEGDFAAADVRNPPFALRINEKYMTVTLTKYEVASEGSKLKIGRAGWEAGKWYDFEVRIRHRAANDSTVEVRRNGEILSNYRGSVGLATGPGKNQWDPYYLKFGLYCSEGIDHPVKAYFDDFSKEITAPKESFVGADLH